MNKIGYFTFGDVLFFFLGALLVWFLLRVRQAQMTKVQLQLKEQISQLTENLNFLKGQLERKDQAISRFIDQLNKKSGSDEKRTMISIRKFEAAPPSVQDEVEIKP